MLKKISITTCATIWNNFVKLFHLIDYRTPLTCLGRWWKGLPGEELVFVRLEELIEIFGHRTVGFALLFSKQIQQSDNSRSAG